MKHYVAGALVLACSYLLGACDDDDEHERGTLIEARAMNQHATSDVDLQFAAAPAGTIKLAVA